MFSISLALADRTFLLANATVALHLPLRWATAHSHWSRIAVLSASVNGFLLRQFFVGNSFL